MGSTGKKIILTGDRPTGKLHLGLYVEEWIYRIPENMIRSIF